MRLLILSPNHKEKWNPEQHLFRMEFAQHAGVLFHGDRWHHSKETNVQKIIDKLGPFDAVFCWGPKYNKQYKSMKDIKIPVIIFYTDYFPHTVNVKNNFINFHEPDMVVVRSIVSLRLFNAQKMGYLIPKTTHGYLLHHGVDPVFWPRYHTRPVDLCASMSENRHFYKNRPAVKAACHELTQYVTCTKRICRLDYAEMLSHSKIFVNSNSIHNPISPKYLEAMASGCLLLTDKPDDADSFGLVDGENCVFYNGINDMKEKAIFYLENWEARARIAAKGVRFINENYMNHHQVKKIMEQVKNLLTRTKA